MSQAKRVAAKPLLDGERIRWTLEQVEQQTQQKVRIDWLRFTFPLDSLVRVDRQPCPIVDELAAMNRYERELMLACRLADASHDYAGAMALARLGAQTIAALLGAFEVGPVEDKGMDYYAARCPLLFEGQVVGYCLAGAKSAQQAGTIHVNLYGEACLYVSPAKWVVLRDWIAQAEGWVTRVDLACDVWAGDDIESIPRAYLGGDFDVRGQRPKQSEAGAWTSGHSRTFYVGKRETGKLFRAYEKGDQLFGDEAGDPWIRYEVEMRNNARVIDLDVLTRPADFFAGAYPFTEALLQRLNVAAESQRIPAGQKLQDKTADAAALRTAAWFRRVCAPTFCRLLVAGGDLLDFIAETEAHRMPERMRGFTPSAMRVALEKVAASFAPRAAPLMAGA